MSEIIRINHATLQLGEKRLFEDFCLNLCSGEWGCVTGESGCGKTSLLRVILGFLPLSAGEVIVNDMVQSVHTIDQIRRTVAYVPQELFLPSDTVSEMFNIPFLLKNNKTKEVDRERVLQVWEALGLDERLMQMKTVELSGGQRQRIMLSMALLLDKPLLLLDEPTSALDAESVERVAAVLRAQTAAGKAVLTVSHHQQLITACDKRFEM